MHQLFTIGYGGRSPQQVAALLKEHGVKVLIDLRETPRTRVPGFSKSALESYMMSQEIIYRHLQALGNANHRIPDAPVKVVDEGLGMQALCDVLTQYEVAIMCACRHHGRCHRSYISERLLEAVPELVIRHIP